jgi:hypothetical protein
MASIRNLWMTGTILVVSGVLATAGCYSTPVPNTDYDIGPAPRRMPSPAREGECRSYEDSLTGGQVWAMYCNQCHNSPSLGERPFANFKNVAAHMRVRANLTGKEYAKLMEFLQRWQDVPVQNPDLGPGPKKLIFSQPLNELKDQPPTTAPGR